jgi:hypothetical protein
MTYRLWSYLEKELNTPDSRLVIETENGRFILEPVIWEELDYVFDIIVRHGSYSTTCKAEPDIWFWEEIENHIFKK